jgi:hypothetical protein
MEFSSYDSYVVVCYISYSGISGDLNHIYTDRAEAEQAAEVANVHYSSLNSSLRASVMTLDDYIDELRSEARTEGRLSVNDSY